ncbi:hypothetical protein TWF696_001167 [Orbilia brochopaga]|uniref:DUF6604 domain-containing protein n=1 Tax=Orbilia brochopaga TaxID=3140254 RepID=A0AAV9VG52_9PEZI
MQHISPILNAIYHLFQATINARTQAYQAFQRLFALSPDAETQKSNAAHKHFIDVLTEAFHALGGKAWMDNRNPGDGGLADSEIEDAILTNKFSTLSLNDLGGRAGQREQDKEGDSEPEGDNEPGEAPLTEASANVPSTSRKTPAKRSGGKKGKKKKTKGKKKANLTSNTSELNIYDVPLESYRIIQDDAGVITDYLMAVYAIVHQWVELRQSLQSIWHDVAYDGLNSAVAGSLSNIAVAMVRQTESSIFVEFPGHDSFETVMNTITRGNIQKAQGMFSMARYLVDHENWTSKVVEERSLDIRDQFLVYTYEDLTAFIGDFQMNRNGRPTKRMQSEIRTWDPNLDLKLATPEQRRKWRRDFTINWLYDLVNVFSSIVVQRKTLKGQKWDLSKVDWTKDGMWDVHRRLYGLNEFAGDITTLVYQKTVDEIRSKILPHHVFQLSCIVDSLAVSRGWSTDVFDGDILTAPPSKFRPRRDVDLFLDREAERPGRGYLQGVDILGQLFVKDAQLHGNPRCHEKMGSILEEIQADFRDWLGETKYMYGLTTIPPSRFSSTNSNGLWEYSPYLCGVGLLEGLDIAFRAGMKVWDTIPEVFCLVHIYNMLVQKGYIARPIGLYDTLQTLFASSFFSGGVPPKSDFHTFFMKTCLAPDLGKDATQRQARIQNTLRTKKDIPHLFDPALNRIFKQKSLVNVYHDVGWHPDRILDEDVPVVSMLATVRLGTTKRVVNHSTGTISLEDTPLVQRAKALGMSNDELLNISSIQDQLEQDRLSQEAYSKMVQEKTTPAPRKKGEKVKFSDSGLLSMLKGDFVNDICGQHMPISSLNYCWTTAFIMLVFTQIEDKLAKCRNRSWCMAYELDKKMTQEKRVSLTQLILEGQDEELLRVVSSGLEEARAGFIDNIYWNELNPIPELMVDGRRSSETTARQHCSIM